jgi:ABC-type transport system involved in multi-copper enzyme maturation permease subunit
MNDETTHPLYLFFKPRNNSPTWAVFKWEMYYISSQPLSLIIVGTYILILAVLMWTKPTWELNNVTIFATSAVGMILTIPIVLLPVFGLLLPFITADVVAHDYKQRVHEILMATNISTRAYTWGRFFASLCVSLILAILMLVTILIMGLMFHLVLPNYPSPNIVGAIIIWSVTVIPVTIVISCISFTAGTLFPRFTTLMKIMIIIGWIYIAIIIRAPDNTHWFTYWNPTSAGMSSALQGQFFQHYDSVVRDVVESDRKAEIAFQLQQQLPDVSPWITPYIALVGSGILLVTFAVVGFRRFRNTLN